MRWRLTACVSVVVLLGAHGVARGQQNPYRLKDLDQKKLCLACHDGFVQKLKMPFVHTAVRSGECSGCHDPHVSSHGTLLAADTKQICAGCHDAVVPANARSAHRVVAEGQCEKCHDPHASANRGLLLAKGNELCLGCHKELGEAIARAKFKHSPVEQGCLGCHGPHGSESESLLKAAVPELCVKCHKADTAAFQARHMRYPVGRAACTSCHDPHGSSQPALMLATVHAPVASGGCNRCHEAADSPEPFATKAGGFELCRACHREMVDTAMGKRRLHWPIAGREGCASCHDPHASKRGKLVKAEGGELCRPCHAETMRAIAAAAVKHPPVAEGNCLACHSAHSAEGTHLIDYPSLIQACATCHDYEKHSAHPIGEKAVDPRNKNLRVDCLSCHTAHGGEFEHMLLAATNVELCTACHKRFSR